ncbi:ATP-binding response regulator [Synoicihabitans lomoniglobus]|uniref:ATP-binding response regulator n=1 Tax=Synoicihabitans lomoniglobus TaxID=2909285 RepID=UPI002ED24355|nr:response regulator [Opitutaceae bacterium LMO-M01]
MDDSARSRALLRALLLPEGYQLLEATTGLEALAVAQADTPDVILLDVMMPGIDGFETCRRVRQHETLREVPIVLLTALNDRESRLAGLSAGADDFLSKPIDTTELKIRLKTITRINRFRSLYEERARFEQAINHAPDGLVVTNAAGNIIIVNRAAQEMLSEDAPLSGNFHGWLTPAASAELEASLDAVQRRHSRPLTTELVYARRFPNQVEITAARLPGNSLIFSLRDITERRELEQQLISIQRLDVLGLLAGGIAHDLNNILCAVEGTASLLLLQAAGKERQQLETIQSHSQRGAEMLSQLLSFSRGSDADISAVDIGEAAKEVAQIAAKTFPSDVEVRFESPLLTTPPLITANAGQLHQIFMNLCVNARDAMPSGGQIIIAVGEETESSRDVAADPARPETGDYVTVSIRDTGTGIAPEVRARIFEPFFSTKSRRAGTGLGLAMVTRLVNLHHGFLSLQSTPGEGSTFTCHFPRSQPLNPGDLPRLPTC